MEKFDVGSFVTKHKGKFAEFKEKLKLKANIF